MRSERKAPRTYNVEYRNCDLSVEAAHIVRLFEREHGERRRLHLIAYGKEWLIRRRGRRLIVEQIGGQP